MKYHMQRQKFIPHSSGGWIVQDQGASHLVSGEACLACGQLPLALSSHGREKTGRGEGALWCLFSYKDTNSFGSGPHPYDFI